MILVCACLNSDIRFKYYRTNISHSNAPTIYHPFILFFYNRYRFNTFYTNSISNRQLRYPFLRHFDIRDERKNSTNRRSNFRNKVRLLRTRKNYTRSFIKLFEYRSRLLHVEVRILRLASTRLIYEIFVEEC